MERLTQLWQSEPKTKRVNEEIKGGNRMVEKKNIFSHKQGRQKKIKLLLVILIDNRYETYHPKN